MRTLRALAAFTLALVPAQAAACAVCLGSAFGDRSYSWAYIGLMMMPFVVAGAVISVLAWQFGWRPRHLVARVFALLRRAAPTDPSPRTHTETT
jgi:hypothetical protein